jgi:hypothetical protein
MYRPAGPRKIAASVDGSWRCGSPPAAGSVLSGAAQISHHADGGWVISEARHPPVRHHDRDKVRDSSRIDRLHDSRCGGREPPGGMNNRVWTALGLFACRQGVFLDDAGRLVGAQRRAGAHLRHAYRKLSISFRGQLPAALRSAAPQTELPPRSRQKTTVPQ